jgi:signal peptidase
MRRAARILLALFATAATAVAVVALLMPAVLHLQRYVITGGSMNGTISRGSIAYDEYVPVSVLTVGDIITFVPPRMHGAVTHRIVSIQRDQRGNPIFRTKGDANAVVDPWHIALPNVTQARYVFAIPYVGYVFAVLSLRWARVALIGLPAALIFISILVSVWREGGKERVKLAAQSAPAETPAVDSSSAPASTCAEPMGVRAR